MTRLMKARSPVRTLLALLMTILVLGGSMASHAADDSTRSFYMGFTPFKYSWVEESQKKTYELMKGHADLIAHHLDDGVPWVEAAEGKPFNAHVEENLDVRLANTAKGSKVYVAATPIDFNRKALAGYWGEKEAMDRPGAWEDRNFDDPEVIKAYLNYCRNLIQRFKPDYFAYGIEVNLLAYNNPDEYQRFITLAKQVYPALKREFPTLPIMLSFYLEPPDRLTETKKHIEPLLPYTDYFAISTYPYMVREGPPQQFKDIPSDWFTQVRQIAPGKPFAIAETGFIAEPLSAFFKTFEGTPEDQKQYATRMLSEANALDAQFVVWFVVADYDDLWTVLKFVVLFNPLAKAWKDTGLYDGELNPRPAMDVWDAWLARPRS